MTVTNAERGVASFNFSMVLLIVSWAAITCALVYSDSTLFTDVYSFLGVLIWASVFVQAAFAEGRLRAFWWTMAATLLFHSFAYLDAMNYLRNELGVPSGGVQFGAFGEDRFYNMPEDRRPRFKEEQRQIVSGQFTRAWKVNLPLILGAILGVVRAVPRRQYWFLWILPCFFLIAIALYSGDAFWLTLSTTFFTVVCILLMTLPLTASGRWYSFALGYSCTLLALTLFMQGASGKRVVMRQILRAHHELFPEATKSFNQIVGSQISQVLVLALPLVGGCIALLLTNSKLEKEKEDAGS